MARINMFTQHLAASDKAKISEETKLNSVIAKDFLTEERYNIVDDRAASFLINRFWTVGFADPYPDDDLNIIGSVDDIPKDFHSPCRVGDRVYPDSRYSDGNSPYCIYIPCKEVMLKLMRACIKVKTPEDLWIMSGWEGSGIIPSCD